MELGRQALPLFVAVTRALFAAPATGFAGATGVVPAVGGAAGAAGVAGVAGATMGEVGPAGSCAVAAATPGAEPLPTLPDPLPELLLEPQPLSTNTKHVI